MKVMMGMDVDMVVEIDVVCTIDTAVSVSCGYVRVRMKKKWRNQHSTGRTT